MRHATAENKADEGDFARSLTEHGEREALAAAEFFQNHKIDKIIVSAAKRTRQTAELIQSKINCSKSEIIPELYSSSEETIIEIISNQDDKDQAIIVIAHNPGIFKASLNLLNQDSPEYEALAEKGMLPANIVFLDFPDLKHWKEIMLKF